jgi:ribosomal protein S12 methylthiotransferase
VGFISLGCAKNLVDSEVMLGHLERAGCALVTDPDEADVLVVNTCAFVESAREESIQAILEAAQRKKNGGVRKVVVAGCMVQRYREELAANLPEVDGFVGLDQLHQIVERVGAAPVPALLPILGQGTGAPIAIPEKASRYLYDHTTPRRRSTSPWTAYLKIAEGCDHTCSFCAIPSFRGAFRSRALESIVAEAEALVATGVRELNLIAQDSSHYGRDLGMSGGPARLLAALDAVAGIRWVRLHYLYPNTITGDLIDAMAKLPAIVPYVDLPLQHAHPATLLRMRRGGSARSHLELLARFRAAMPEVALRTTLITGFPGETDEEFDALLAFVEEARFDHLGVFTYSHEEGTSATALADDVPESVKDERRARLLEVQQGISFARNAGRVGTRVEVLVEGAHPETEHLLVGRMATQAPDVDGAVILNDGQAAPGSFVSVEITESAGYDVVGRILGGA